MVDVDVVEVVEVVDVVVELVDVVVELDVVELVDVVSCVPSFWGNFSSWCFSFFFCLRFSLSLCCVSSSGLRGRISETVKGV